MERTHAACSTPSTVTLDVTRGGKAAGEVKEEGERERERERESERE